MGGMSAQIPIKDDPKANEVAMDKVRSDKLREVTAGHDGTWIAHPLINTIARKIFDDHMLGPNQVHYFFFSQISNFFEALISTTFFAKKSKSPLMTFSIPRCRAR